MTSATTRTAGYSQSSRAPWSRLLVAGLITVVAAIAANLVARAVVFAVAALDPAFPPLTPGAIAFFTALGVGLGSLVFALIARRAGRPLRTWRTVAVIALVLSILPNLALMANPAAAPFPGGTAGAFATLILFHIVAGIVAIVLLPTLSRMK